MQRYYHKGAFYQGSDERVDDDLAENSKILDEKLAKRDFNLPTAEDKRDYSILPAVLQKRAGQFGRKGQSKWTHLGAEDTTDFNPMTKVPENVARK